MNYTVFKIPKRNGKFRTIYAPDDELKAKLQELVLVLARAARRVDKYGIQHAFTEGRSPVTNALAHLGQRFTLSFDLSDFFDSVTKEHVRTHFAHDRIPTEIQSEIEIYCLIDGAARQGLPTSPALANIAAGPMDLDIMDLNIKGRFGKLFVYTRYADDLTFSFDLPSVGDMLRRMVPIIAQQRGFAINPAKTHWQDAHAGRRIITGVAIDSQGAHPARQLKRRLRAARHQADHSFRPRHLSELVVMQKEKLRRTGEKTCLYNLHRGHLAGLEEWAKLRLPKAARQARRAVRGAAPVQTRAQSHNPVPEPRTFRPYERKMTP